MSCLEACSCLPIPFLFSLSHLHGDSAKSYFYMSQIRLLTTLLLACFFFCLFLSLVHLQCKMYANYFPQCSVSSPSAGWLQNCKFSLNSRSVVFKMFPCRISLVSVLCIKHLRAVTDIQGRAVGTYLFGMWENVCLFVFYSHKSVHSFPRVTLL